MHSYELMFITRTDVDEETVKATRDKVESVITAGGGEIVSFDDMGKRRLAYEIDGKYREGIYSLCNFRSNPDVVSELERIININDNILRHLTINTDERSA